MQEEYNEIDQSFLGGWSFILFGWQNTEDYFSFNKI
jgi:hypothetical protein